MKPYDQLTILRNRHRVRELRIFRDLVERYFEQAEYVADDLPVDWEAARAARSQINRMLPRVLRIVYAAGLGPGDDSNTDPGPPVADVDILRNIFGARYADGADQEILDLIDMAVGVYDANRFSALARTVNPVHYAASLLGFVVGLPRRALIAVGLLSRRRRVPRIRPEDVARLEAAASRLRDTEALIERRFAELRDRQAQQLAESNNQLAELAERLDFAERVLAQQRPPKELPSPPVQDVVTPV